MRRRARLRNRRGAPKLLGPRAEEHSPAGRGRAMATKKVFLMLGLRAFGNGLFSCFVLILVISVASLASFLLV